MTPIIVNRLYGKISLDSSGVKNVLYLKFSVNGNVYEYLIPRDKKINTFRIVTYSKEYTKNKYDWMNKIDEQ